MKTKNKIIVAVIPLIVVVAILSVAYINTKTEQVSLVPSAQVASPSAAALEKLLFVENSLDAKGLDGPAEVIGELRVIHADDIENDEAKFEYFVTDASNARVYEVKANSVVENLKAGSIIKVKGSVNSNTIVPAETPSGDADIQVLNEPEPLVVQETRRVLVIPANYSDKSLECSQSQLQNTYFNTLRANFEESTNGTISLAGDVLPVTTLTYDSSTYNSYSLWAAELNQYAQSLGYNTSNYDHVSYVTPRNPSGYAGLGNLNGPLTWIYYCNYPGVIQHEIGHNLGMHHASTQSSEYGDYSGMMGGGSGASKDWNAPHKDQMAWVPNSSVIAPTSGTFTLASLDVPLTDLTNPRIIKAFRPSSNDYYYFSYRTREGVSGSLETAYNNKVNIHTYTGSGAVRTYYLRSLAIGETFTDSSIGLSLTFLSTSADGALVSVNAVCAASAPEVTLSPVNVSSVDEAPKTFQVSVTNPPANGCGESTFSLDVTAPSGWTVENSFGSQTIATGQTTVTNITITPGSDTVDATYKLDFVATNENETLSGIGYGYYTLDSAVPTAPTNLTLSAKRKFNTLDWNTPGSDIASYNVYRNGVQIGSSETTSFQDKFLTSGTLEYTVTAVGTNGLESPESSAVSTDTTLDGGDTTNGGNAKGGGGSKCTPWPSCRNN